MATGTAPALDPKIEAKTETSSEAFTAQPASFKERVGAMLRTVFEGREEYLGWHQ
jgi:hypothetical protein